MRTNLPEQALKETASLTAKTPSAAGGDLQTYNLTLKCATDSGYFFLFCVLASDSLKSLKASCEMVISWTISQQSPHNSVPHRRQSSHLLHTLLWQWGVPAGPRSRSQSK